MPHKITYYAIIDGDTTADRPLWAGAAAGIHDDGPEDEGLRRDFSWSFTPIIVEWKRGDFDDELVEVSHAQASKIIEYFREKWGPFGQPVDS